MRSVNLTDETTTTFGRFWGDFELVPRLLVVGVKLEQFKVTEARPKTNSAVESEREALLWLSGLSRIMGDYSSDDLTQAKTSINDYTFTRAAT